MNFLRIFIVFLFAMMNSIAIAEDFVETSSGSNTDIGFKGIAGKIGGVYISTREIGFIPAAGLWFDLGKLLPSVNLDAGVEYWLGSWIMNGTLYRKKDIAVYTTMKYEIRLNKIKPFAGGGLGVNFYKKLYPESSNQQDETKPKLELHLDMGTVYSLNEKIDLEGRIKVNFSDFGTYGLYISAIFKTGQSQ